MVEKLKNEITSMKQLIRAAQETVRILKRGFYPASATEHVQPLIDFNKRQAAGGELQLKALELQLKEAEQVEKKAVADAPEVA